MAFALLLAALAGVPAGAVTLRSDVRVAGRDVRVGDLAAPDSRLDPAVRARLVMRLSAANPRATLPVASAAALLRRRVPGLRIVAPARIVTVAITGATTPAPGRAATCYATRRALPPGPVATGDLTPVVCRPGARSATIHYDARSRGAVTDEALGEGSYVGQLLQAASGMIAKGMPLVLRATSGPVVIERQVTALQPGRSGGRVFVRDAQGQVFAAPLALAGETR